VLRENRVPTTPKGIEEVFGKIPPNRIALETVTHSPWVSRQLTRWGHEVIVAHARNVRLIGDSSRKDDRLDAWTLAPLASINPQLVGAGATPQCRGTNPSDGNPRSSGAGQWSHGIGECGTRVDEILWRAAAEMWHPTNESGDGQRSEPGVARCFGSSGTPHR
jgi:hypothetical protein